MLAVGLRIKTGFAVAVVLERRQTNCVAVRRELVALSTQSVPDSQQPYHPALELPADRGEQVTARAVTAVRETARREMQRLLTDLTGLRRAGLVVGSLAKPDSIGNPHIRAHALEGKLFREVVSEALEARGLTAGILLEREAYDQAAGDLDRPAAGLRSEIDLLGKGTIKPWRAEEKLAALAAYWQLLK
jgi:hypothetical protein